jgi:hypothetical protein
MICYKFSLTFKWWPRFHKRVPLDTLMWTQPTPLQHISKIHFILFSCVPFSPPGDLFPPAVTMASMKVKTKLYFSRTRSCQHGRCESRRVREISISYEPGRSCSSSQLGRMLFHGPVAALYRRRGRFHVVTVEEVLLEGTGVWNSVSWSDFLGVVWTQSHVVQNRKSSFPRASSSCLMSVWSTAQMKRAVVMSQEYISSIAYRRL